MLSEEAIVQVINAELEVELRDWQIEYIFGRSEYLESGRGNGKTLSYILRLILSEGEPIHVYKTNILQGISDETNIYYTRYWFYDRLRTIYHKLSTPDRGLNLRKIYFSILGFKIMEDMKDD